MSGVLETGIRYVETPRDIYRLYRGSLLTIIDFSSFFLVGFSLFSTKLYFTGE